MRKLILTIVAAAAAFTAGAALKWVESAWDFGTIKEADGKVGHEFVAVNDGTDTVTIKSSRSSCGCTTAKYTQTPIAPGDTARIMVEFNPNYRPGPFEKHVQISTTGLNYVLDIKGTVDPLVETLGRIYPEKAGSLRLTRNVVLIGDVRQGHRRTSSINCFNVSQDTLVLSFRYTDTHLYVTSTPTIVKPRGTASISITYEAGKDTEIGRTEFPIEIFSGDHYLCRVKGVATVVPENPTGINPEKSPRIQASVERIYFQSIGKDKLTKTVQIKNTGRGELHITGGTTMSDEIKVKEWPKTIKAGKTADLVVELDPKKMADDVLNSSIVLYTNDPLNGTFQLRVVGAKQTENK